MYNNPFVRLLEELENYINGYITFNEKEYQRSLDNIVYFFSELSKNKLLDVRKIQDSNLRVEIGLLNLPNSRRIKGISIHAKNSDRYNTNIDIMVYSSLDYRIDHNIKIFLGLYNLFPICPERESCSIIRQVECKNNVQIYVEENSISMYDRERINGYSAFIEAPLDVWRNRFMLVLSRYIANNKLTESNIKEVSNSNRIECKILSVRSINITQNT